MLVFVRLASQEGNDIGSQTRISYEEFGPENGLGNENDINNYVPSFPSMEEEDEQEIEKCLSHSKEEKENIKNLD